MSADEIVLDCLLDPGHVASNALTACTPFSVVRVFAYRAAESGGILFRVAKEAQGIAWPHQIRCVRVTVNLMAVKAANAAMVHVALNEVVTLHPILVRCHVGILIKARRPKFARLEHPIVGKTLSR